jgi:drug/metabolite transporter (DMT)-like permease
MNNWFLYSLTVLIWGSTWIGIKYQLGDVDPMASIGHRFALASLLIGLFLLWRRESLVLATRHHPFLVLQGLCLFCWNYYFVYHAELVLASGLVAVVFGGIMIANVVNGAIFLGTAIRPGVVMGGLIGLGGMAIVFWPELNAVNLADENFSALLLCLVGTLLASFGNIIAARNKLQQVPLLPGNTWAMAYGALAMYAAALLLGRPITFAWTAAYTLSLLYLVVFGSIIAFWAYLTLLGNIGADRAGYANLVFPLVALAISTALEDYQWTLTAVQGLGLVVVGNWMVMRSQRSGHPDQPSG